MSGPKSPPVQFPARRFPARRLLKARRRLRADVTQLLFAVTGLALGLALPRVEVGPTVDGGRLLEPMFTLGIGVIGVVSLVYSLLFGVVQWSASSFSPRLNQFRADALVWRTFAFAVGVFVFCVTAGLACVDSDRVSVMVPVTAILAVLAAIALIRGLQTRAFLSLQLAHVLATIVSRGLSVINDVYPAPASTDGGAAETGTPLPSVRNVVTWPGPSGVVQQLELLHLVDVAARADALVVLAVGVGDTLQQGSHLADVHGGALPDSAVRRAVVRASERSFDQDPLLAFRLLADIGLRALSPALNDPATTVDTLDAMDGLLMAVVGRDLDVANVADSSGVTRVRLLMPAWDDFLRTGIEDLLPAAAGSGMVLLRLQLLLANLHEVAPPTAQTAIARLSKQVDRLLDRVRSEL